MEVEGDLGPLIYGGPCKIIRKALSECKENKMALNKSAKHFDGIDDIEDYPTPVCPLNLYFEGDNVESKLCNYDPKIRMCYGGCKKGS